MGGRRKDGSYLNRNFDADQRMDKEWKWVDGQEKSKLSLDIN